MRFDLFLTDRERKKSCSRHTWELKLLEKCWDLWEKLSNSCAYVCRDWETDLRSGVTRERGKESDLRCVSFTMFKLIWLILRLHVNCCRDFPCRSTEKEKTALHLELLMPSFVLICFFLLLLCSSKRAFRKKMIYISATELQICIQDNWLFSLTLQRFKKPKNITSFQILSMSSFHRAKFLKRWLLLFKIPHRCSRVLKIGWSYYPLKVFILGECILSC